jgi:hypothetical protein
LTAKSNSSKNRVRIAATGSPDMVFYILTPHKIEAHENSLREFLADDLLFAIQAGETKIATDEECLSHLEKAYPKYYRYEVRVGKF